MQLSSILARSVAGHQAANLGGLPKAVVDLLNSLKLQANGDAFATGEGLSFSFTGSDLLGNDGGVTKSLVSVQATSASGATITSAGGVFSYDPGVRFDWLGAGETALDSFTYTIRNAAGQTSTAAVTVTVSGENDPVLLDDPLPAVAQMSELTRNEDHPDGDGAIHLVSGAFGFHDADLSDLPGSRSTRTGTATSAPATCRSSPTASAPARSAGRSSCRSGRSTISPKARP